MLLAADAERAFQPPRRGGDGLVRIAAQESIVRHHGAIGGESVIHRDERLRLLDRDLRQPGRPAGRIARLGNHGEERLLVIEDLALREGGLVGGGRRDVVAARHIRRRHDRHDAGMGLHSREIEAGQPAGGLRREAERNMQEARRLAHIIDIGCGALDLQRRGIVRDGLPHDLQRMLGFVIIRDGLLDAEGFKPHGRPPLPSARARACLSRRRSRSAL